MASLLFYKYAIFYNLIKSLDNFCNIFNLLLVYKYL